MRWSSRKTVSAPELPGGQHWVALQLPRTRPPRVGPGEPHQISRIVANVGRNLQNSKRRSTWHFSFGEGGDQHEVVLEHSTFSGKKRVYLNGSLLCEGQRRGSAEWSHGWRMDNHLCRCDVLADCKYELSVDAKPFPRWPRADPHTRGRQPERFERVWADKCSEPFETTPAPMPQSKSFSGAATGRRSRSRSAGSTEASLRSKSCKALPGPPLAPGASCRPGSAAAAPADILSMDLPAAAGADAGGGGRADAAMVLQLGMQLQVAGLSASSTSGAWRQLPEWEAPPPQQQQGRAWQARLQQRAWQAHAEPHQQRPEDVFTSAYAEQKERAPAFEPYTPGTISTAPVTMRGSAYGSDDGGDGSSDCSGDANDLWAVAARCVDLDDMTGDRSRAATAAESRCADDGSTLKELALRDSLLRRAVSVDDTAPCTPPMLAPPPVFAPVVVPAEVPFVLGGAPPAGMELVPALSVGGGGGGCAGVGAVLCAPFCGHDAVALQQAQQHQHAMALFAAQQPPLPLAHQYGAQQHERMMMMRSCGAPAAAASAGEPGFGAPAMVYAPPPFASAPGLR